MSSDEKQSDERREVRVEDLKQGPLRHSEGLTPLLEGLARDLFATVGRFVCPTFEQWELGFMRDMHPWRELLIWETIARTYKLYLAEHPEAEDDNELAGTIVSLSLGVVPENLTEKEKDLQRFYRESCEKRWLPLSEEPYEFSPNAEPVLEYEDIVDETDTGILPNLQGEVDPRRMLVSADIIVGIDTASNSHVCIHGYDHLEDGQVPEGCRTLEINLDTSGEQLEKISAIAELIKRFCK